MHMGQTSCKYRLQKDASGFWLSASPINSSLELTHGWKLHVSSCNRDAILTLDRSLPILFAREAHFKFCATEENLRKQIRGDAGESQVGKFITVYPRDDVEAVALAQSLDVATEGLVGPRVPTDRQLRSGSRVSYRYGAFRPLRGKTPSGEVLDFYPGEGGRPVPDLRRSPYAPPMDQDDPFEKAGVASPYVPRGRVIADRFLCLKTLANSRSRRVLACFDLDLRKPVVLKEASLHDEYGTPGYESRDLIRYELESLRAFADSNHFPAPIDCFDVEDYRLLVMEYISGQTLEQVINAANITYSGLEWPEIVGFFGQIVKILSTLHAVGYVYGDLKSTNILVTEGVIKLVDLEFCRMIGTSLPKGVGTRGYVSDARRAGEMLSIKDDIYALGAVLYMLCTGAEPSIAPAEKPLLFRPISALKPGLPRSAHEAIEGALSQAFHSAEEMLNCLLSLQNSKVLTLRALNVQSIGGRDALNLAIDLGCKISADAILAPQSISWRNFGQATKGIDTKDINTGSAGTLLALTCLERYRPQEERADLIRKCAHSLRQQMPEMMRIPGMYMGIGGTALALLNAGLALGDDDLSSLAQEMAISAALTDVHSPDLFNGKAGLLRTALIFFRVFGDVDTLQIAKRLGDQIISLSHSGESGFAWAIPEGYGGLSGQTYLGYAHGAAGIADCLLDLYDVTADSQLLKAVVGAADLLTHNARDVGTDGQGLAWGSSVGTDPVPAFWCHGAGGISRFFLRLAERGLYEGAEPISRRALWSVANSIRWSRPTLCHGIAGGIHALIDGYHVFGESSFFDAAQHLCGIMATFASRSDTGVAWETQSYGSSTAEYMVGYSGLIPTLLRVHDPLVADPLTLAGY